MGRLGRGLDQSVFSFGEELEIKHRGWDGREEGQMTGSILPSKRDVLGLPDKQGIDLALSFAKVAKNDLRAGIVLYRNKLYPQAVFEMQQSVEKAVKAVGLLLRLAKPNKEDLGQETGNAIIFGILIRRNERLAQLRKNLGILAASEDLKEGKDLFMKLGLPWTIPEPSEMEARLLNERATNEEIARLRNLKPRDLWRITLEFDPRRPPNPAILRLLSDSESHWKPLDKLQRLLERKLAPLMSDPETLRYVLNVYGKAFPELAPLAFLTMWHEREARYPPLDDTEYWNPRDYRATAGLVKLYPRLLRHAKRLCEGTVDGAVAAQRLRM